MPASGPSIARMTSASADLPRRTGEQVPAVRAPAALDETGLAQALQDVLEELHGDVLRARQRLGLHVANRTVVLLGGRELDAGADGVIDLRGDPQRVHHGGRPPRAAQPSVSSQSIQPAASTISASAA
jgi:hypothetical protein